MSYWKKDVSNPIAYKSEYYADGQSIQSCSAFRVADIDGAALNFKYDFPYSMRAGYKIYDTVYSDEPIAQGTGFPIEISFESAINLVVASISAMATIIFF